MKKQVMMMAFGALLVSGIATAVASPYQQDYQDQSSHNDHRDNNDHRNNRDHRDDRNHRDDRTYVQHDRGHQEGWYRRGGRMPEQYRGSRYVVSDWRAYHLRQPPRGYRWVRSDNGDFLLVAVTTGIITSIIANAIVNGR